MKAPILSLFLATAPLLYAQDQSSDFIIDLDDESQGNPLAVAPDFIDLGDGLWLPRQLLLDGFRETVFEGGAQIVLANDTRSVEYPESDVPEISAGAFVTYDEPPPTSPFPGSRFYFFVCTFTLDGFADRATISSINDTVSHIANKDCESLPVPESLVGHLF